MTTDFLATVREAVRDETTLRTALADAEIAPLLMSLVQLTGDLDLMAEVAPHIQGPWSFLQNVPADLRQTVIDRLVAEVTKGFRGDVGVVPRQFLREFVTQLDLVEENDDYVPMELYGFDPSQISTAAFTPEEQQRLGVSSDSAPLDELEEGPELIPTEDVW